MYDEDMKTWEDAKDACSNRTNWNYNVDYNNENTMLVAIDSQEENDDLWNMLSEWGGDSAWIGLSWNCKYKVNVALEYESMNEKNNVYDMKSTF